MSIAKISDAEAHELVMKRWDAMTRDEWLSWLDHVAEVFGPYNDTGESNVSGVAPGEYRLHRPTRTSEVVLNGSHPKPKPSKKKPALKTAHG